MCFMTVADRKNPSTEEILALARKALDDTRDYLEEFRRRQAALEERVDEWERDYWWK